MRWLFVYGTLMPGHLRWPAVAADVVLQRPAAVAGRLYDTGRGYPALVLGDGDGVETPVAPAVLVTGRLLGVPDHRAAAVLRRLDVVEGPRYRRVAVTTTDGTVADTYEWIGPPAAGFTPLDGPWDREDER